jgi:starch phosphorylase
VTELHQKNGYMPREIYDRDVRLQQVFQFVRQLHPNPQHFDYVLNNLLNSDYFLVMKDFASYLNAHEKANEAYKDRYHWLRMSLINIANSGYFTSDRTISQYNEDIWKLRKIEF